MPHLDGYVAEHLESSSLSSYHLSFLLAGRKWYVPVCRSYGEELLSC